MNELSKRSEIKKQPRERMKKDVREKEDNGRGNGIWHDAMRSEGSYTSLFLYSSWSSSSEDDADKD